MKDYDICRWLTARFRVCFSNHSLPHHFDYLYQITHGDMSEEEVSAMRQLCSYHKAKWLVHCVFSMQHLHGDISAGVSHQIAEKYHKDIYVCHMVVPYIPSMYSPLIRFPENVVVFGHYGGKHSINISWAKNVISSFVRERNDVQFLFMNDECFDTHPSLHFLSGTADITKKRQFIMSVDAMIMPEELGHSFGLAMLEFMIAGKPIIVYNGPVWNDAHLRMLGSDVIGFSTPDELYQCLQKTQKHEWKDYRHVLKHLTPSKIIEDFERTFLI